MRTARLTRHALKASSLSQYVIHRAIADEIIQLKVIAHRDNAPDLVRYVEINALTGLITEMSAPGG